MSLTIFGSGHRPEDAGMSLEEMHLLCCENIKAAVTPITTVISGGAAGFDLAIAQAAVSLELDLYIVRPWAGHKFRVADRKDWDKVLSYSRMQQMIFVDPSLDYPGADTYRKRNEFMVNNANAGLVLWNGKKSGGTYGCIKYADSVGKPYRNIYPKLVG